MCFYISSCKKKEISGWPWKIIVTEREEIHGSTTAATCHTLPVPICSKDELGAQGFKSTGRKALIFSGQRTFQGNGHVYFIQTKKRWPTWVKLKGLWDSVWVCVRGDNCNNWAINAIIRALGRMYFESDVNILSPKNTAPQRPSWGRRMLVSF